MTPKTETKNAPVTWSDELGGPVKWDTGLASLQALQADLEAVNRGLDQLARGEGTYFDATDLEAE